MEAMKLQKRVPVSAMLDPKIVFPAMGSAVAKLDPRLMIKNPVMFVVEIVAALTTVRTFCQTMRRRRGGDCSFIAAGS